MISVQVCIFIFGSLALYLLTREDKKRRLIGCVVGVVSQPLWAYSGYITGQWGILAMSVIYLFFYIQGVRNNK